MNLARIISLVAKPLAIGAATLGAVLLGLSAPAQANPNVSVQIGGVIAPGVYGSVQVGRPAPQVIYPAPVLVYPAPQPVYHAPIYHAPVYGAPVYGAPVVVNRPAVVYRPAPVVVYPPAPVYYGHPGNGRGHGKHGRHGYDHHRGHGGHYRHHPHHNWY